MGSLRLRSKQLLDATGRLCALHLIAEFAGYTVHREPTRGDYHPVDICAYEPNSTLRAALSTRLFAGVGEGCFTPVHRHIAEFLGARHLARLIEDGLPARRISRIDCSARFRGNRTERPIGVARGALPGGTARTDRGRPNRRGTVRRHPGFYERGQVSATGIP